MTSSGVIVLLGREHTLAAAISDELRGVGYTVLERLPTSGELDALVIVTPPPRLCTPVLEVTDAQLTSSLNQFLDLFAALADGAARVCEGGAVVVVSDRGHLGGWHGAHEMAFSGATAGLLRSVALENIARRVRANLIAVELADAKKPSDPAEVARLTAFLISTASTAVNGEVILANAGMSLQIREARNRRPDHP